MNTSHAERIFLIGPTGSGKTSVAAHLAALLGWTALDTDAAIEQASGRAIADIFASEGEARFRDLEGEALADALRTRLAVIATGAGIVERPEHIALMREHGWVVALVARPETALARIRAEAGERNLDTLRPMLAGTDPLDRIQALHARRDAAYRKADTRVATDDLSAETAAARIVAGLVARGRLPSDGAHEATRHVRTASGPGYDAVVQWGGLATLPERLHALGLPRRLHVVADARVAQLYEPELMAALLAAEFEPLIYRVPPGEASKSRAQLDGIHDWLAERRAERGEAVIAVGGGVVGDLAGFAAATYLRGLPLVQVPTSLLAQVDASIGGKVAIDHPRGKNLIGAFYPPRLVLADPATLLTLAPRLRIEGWAEVVKHGVALDAGYFAGLERDVEALLVMAPAAVTATIAGSVSLKAAIVEEDEREGEGGRRHLLNYGHTVAHAIEAVAGYGAWLHGEAVAVGMCAAARLGQRLGITPADVVERQEALLQRFGLPTRADGFMATALLRAALWDKKVRSGRMRWVLPSAVGTAALVPDVPEEEVIAALCEIGAAPGEA